MRTVFLLLMAFASLCTHAQKSIDKDHFYNLIKAKNYPQLLVDAHMVRKEVYGKIWLVDYYIAKANCGLGKPQNAIEWFNSSLKYPNVNNDIRKFLLAEMGSCNSGQASNTVLTTGVAMPDKSLLNITNLPTSGVMGKSGPIYNCKTPPQPVALIQPKSAAEFESRIFDLDKSAEAIRKYKILLNANYHISVSGRFLLITYGNNVLNNEQASKISGLLERTYNFFCQYYNLRPPDKLLAVYLLPDKNILRQTALRVHGIKIPDANIGYSNLGDLSLLGISDLTHIGTLCHELFHLMIRTDVGDVSPWMDEGIASVYETSQWKDSQLKGDLENWRTDVLRNARWNMQEKIPRLRQFLNFNWDQFNGLETTDQCQGAINYAYGKHLMLYCQELGKLPILVSAFKDRNLFVSENEDYLGNDIELFEKALNNPIDSIEKQFNQWMDKTYHLKLSSQAYIPNNSFHPVNQANAPISQNIPRNTSDAGNQNIIQQTEQIEIPETGIANQAMQQNMANQTIITNAAVQKSLVKPEANEILDSLTLHVKIDNADKMGNSVAYSYYLEGDDILLDSIAEVYYQRNHPSMSEYKTKTYKKSTTRPDKFLFKAYQWGYIDSAYVYIVTTGGTQSETVLKTIKYDK
ncbi:MAG: hypothetical protein U0Z17_02540 [Bacteroidales bacterium]